MLLCAEKRSMKRTGTKESGTRTIYYLVHKSTTCHRTVLGCYTDEKIIKCQSYKRTPVAADVNSSLQLKYIIIIGQHK